ncbi:hypothetical protein [Streptomyces sp. MB09-02B]|uniref:hypothetical protein n=1 Tax=Streptomyces sp. MB09-02B TaxID=3028667 RepID=UPI0029B45BD0|nr:hypothetical protein [Streptomyces sp. MB09-02B]MDX3642913.1 hypothetical protein [Streptomyces sp. MB09-02B]
MMSPMAGAGSPVEGHIATQRVSMGKRRPGLRGLPSETGNAAPGFAPVARQSALI